VARLSRDRVEQLDRALLLELSALQRHVRFKHRRVETRSKFVDQRCENGPRLRCWHQPECDLLFPPAPSPLNRAA
jgi:hypothetical protein